jgi:hypothetical protein
MLLIKEIGTLLLSGTIFSALQMECSRLLYKTLALSGHLDPQESMHDKELLSMASNILVQVLLACC